MRTTIKRVLLSGASLLAVTLAGYAQTALPPAKLTITPTTPEALQVLDSTGAWVPVGSVDQTLHQFVPANISAVDIRRFGAQITGAPGVQTTLVDPAGTFDNTPAFNRACAANIPFYIPPGRYHVKDKISCSLAVIWGAGTYQSIIDVGSDFNMSATGVIDLLSVATGQGGSQVHNVGMQFYQDPNKTYTDLSGLIHYPPGYTASQNGRAILDNIEMERCYDGIVTTINTIINLTGTTQLGCFNHPLHIDGNLDWTFWDAVEVWPFGMSGNLTTLYRQNLATVELGHIDGLMVNSLAMFRAGVHVLSSASGAVGFNFSKVQFDNGNGFVVDAGQLTINQLFGDNGGYPILTMGGAYDSTQVTIEDCRCNVGNTINYIVNHGGQLLINGGIINWTGNAGGSAIQLDDTINGSRTVIRNILQHGLSGVAPPGTFINQSGVNVGLVVNGINNLNSALPTVPFISTVDVSSNSFQNIQFGGSGQVPMSIALSAPVKGYYDLPNTGFPITITPIFTTMGDFAPANNVTFGYYKLRGDYVEFQANETFDTNAFTTAGGSFALNTNLPYGTVPSGASGAVPIVIGTTSNVTYGTMVDLQAQVRNVNPVQIQFTRSINNTPWSQLTTGNIIPSKPGIQFILWGRYDIR